MNYDTSEENFPRMQNEENFRKFLSGNKVCFSQAFWENSPRRLESAEGQPGNPEMNDTRTGAN